MTKKIFAMFLAVLMVMSLLPVSAIAAGNKCPGKDVEHNMGNCDYTVVGVTKPTCGTYGFTTYKCNECKKTFADNIVPAVGEHNWEAAEDVAPTCGEYGLIGAMKCTICGTKKDGTPVPPVVKEGISCEWVAQNKDVDCTTGGIVKYVCAHCGAAKEVKVEKKGNAHAWNYDKMSVKVAATADKAGIVVIPCGNKNCPATKEVEWFADHDCAEALDLHKAIAATCTTDGVIAHYECRVCGKLYKNAAATEAYRDNETVNYGGVIVPAAHTKPASFVEKCSDQTVKCTVCEQKFVVKGEHDPQPVVNGTIAATCTTKGYVTKMCSRCNMPVVTEIPAKGHVMVTRTVPSTCGTYAYTFTACMREGCNVENEATSNVWIDIDNGGLSYDVSLGRVVADQLILNEVGYKLSLVQETLGETLYWVTDKYSEGATSEAGGTTVYLEAYKDYRGNVVEGAYRLYYYNGSSTPRYLIANKSGNYVNPAYVNSVKDGDANYWTWNETYGVMTFNINGTEYFLNAYNANSKLGMSEMKYITSETTYPAYLTYQTADVHVIEIEVDTKSGFNADNHDIDKIVTPATCYGDGAIHYFCTTPGCGWSKDEVIKKVDHKWNALGIVLKYSDHNYSATLKTDEDEYNDDLMTIFQALGLTIDGNTVSALEKLFTKPTCTTAGSYFGQCEFCGKVEKKVLNATGHYFKDNAEVKHQAGSHTSNEYDYIECANNCGERKKFNVSAWADKNKYWDSVEKAQEAHNNKLSATSQIISNGSCTTAGLLKYTCTECKQPVFVKRTVEVEVVYNGAKHTISYQTGSHYPMIQVSAEDKTLVPFVGDIVDPSTCQRTGSVTTFYCPVCEKTIGNGEYPGDVTELPLADHSYTKEMTKNQIKQWIGSAKNPCPNAKAYVCKWCDAVKGDLDLDTIDTTNLCSGVAFEFYLCSCGEEHVRGLYGEFGHEFVNVVPGSYIEPTHDVRGTVTYVCTYCDKTKTVDLGYGPHVNAAGEEFTDACTDKVTDRHCVLCCKHSLIGGGHDCYKKDKNGKYICDCMIVPDHHYTNISGNMNSSCTMLPYFIQICDDCGKQNVVTIGSFDYNFDDLVASVNGVYNVKDNLIDLEKLTVADTSGVVDFKGHKPAEIDVVDGKEVRYANYVYVENFKWTSYEWVKVNVPKLDEDGKVVVENDEVVCEEKLVLAERVEVFTAKFAKYQKTSYAAEGSWTGYCQICDGEVTQIIPKLVGVGFELNAANANGAASNVTAGSLIAVKVSLNSLNTGIYGFNMSVAVPEGTVFVGHDQTNFDFFLNITDRESAYSAKVVEIIGYAANNESGKMQDVVINEKTEMVTLFFRVVNNAAGKLQFNVANASASNLEIMADKDAAALVCNNGATSIKCAKLGDFDGNNEFNAMDMYAAMSILTGESKKTYDVTVDMDKDGEITLADISYAYGMLVGNYSNVDFLFNGVEADEAAFLNDMLFAKTYHCINENCTFSADEAFVICPKCLTIQLKLN